MTGEHHGVQTVEFEMEKACLEAAEYIFKTTDKVYNNRKYIPIPKCIRL
jgi:hypothetical protein